MKESLKKLLALDRRLQRGQASMVIPIRLWAQR